MSFIQSQLYNAVTTKYVNPIFDPNYCQLKPDNKRNSFDSGLYLEALSVFAYRTNNDTLIQQYVYFVIANGVASVNRRYPQS